MREKNCPGQGNRRMYREAGGDHIGDEEEGEQAKALHALARIADDEHVPDEERQGHQKEGAPLVGNDGESIADGHQVSDDHGKVDDEDSQGKGEGHVASVLLANQFDQPFAGVPANARGDGKDAPEHGDGEQHDPADAVSEGGSGDGGGEHRGGIEIGCARHHSAHERSHAAVRLPGWKRLEQADWDVGLMRHGGFFSYGEDTRIPRRCRDRCGVRNSGWQPSGRKEELPGGNAKAHHVGAPLRPTRIQSTGSG